jgi:hypothetical protein
MQRAIYHMNKHQVLKASPASSNDPSIFQVRQVKCIVIVELSSSLGDPGGGVEDILW